jgi:predicted permease
MFSRILFDVRLAVRLLLRSPGFAAGTIAMLVLGIGATTAMFSLVEALFMRPLPYPHAEELDVVWSDDWNGPESMSFPDFEDFRRDTTDFAYMAAMRSQWFSISIDDRTPFSRSGSAVSGDFFPLFGLPPLRGRLIGPEDAQLGRPHVAVISEALWQTRFGAAENVVGRVVSIDGEPYTIIGIAADGFRYCEPHSSGGDVWVPLLPSEGLGKSTGWDFSARGSHFLRALARRRSNVTSEETAAQFLAIGNSLEARYPQTNTKRIPHLKGFHDAITGRSKDMVWVLFAAVAFVYVVVCANLANILLARASARRGEMAMRAALGATRAALLRQVVTETWVLFAAGTAGGALLARVLVERFAFGVVTGSAHTLPIAVDAWALAFTTGIALLSGTAIGIFAAFGVSSVAPHAALKDTAARSSGSIGQLRMRAALVVVQVAVAFALLVGSGISLQAFSRLAKVPLGFTPDGLVVFTVDLPEKTVTDESIVTLTRAIFTEIGREPAVESVSQNAQLPFGGSNRSSSFEIEGHASFPRGEEPEVEHNGVMPGYFHTMQIPILRGRDLTDDDRKGGRLVILVNQHLAEHFFPGEDPVGKRISWDGEEWREIVGVVADSRRSLRDPIGYEAYAPLTQDPATVLQFAARTRAPELLIQRLPTLMQHVDPRQALARVDTMVAVHDDWLAQERWGNALLGAFAAAALVLAGLGLFGLVSYATSQRTRELGIRMALGSTPGGVMRLVMKDGLGLLGAGLALGIACAALVGRTIAARITGATPFDLEVYAGIAVILGAAGLIACLLPAWRAVRIPPSVALRYE